MLLKVGCGKVTGVGPPAASFVIVKVKGVPAPVSWSGSKPPSRLLIMLSAPLARPMAQIGKCYGLLLPI